MRPFFPVKILNQWLIISSRFVLTADVHVQTRKMSWESEKQKYLSMYESRQDPNWIKWQEIQTWKQFAQENDLPKPAPPLPGYNIDHAKNELLADKISIFTKDITKIKIEAIVNAANKYLKRGGGVDGAIHAAAGKWLQNECDTLNGCETGNAKITGGYKLPAKYVIATVGPQGENTEALRNCYFNSLSVALANNVRTIAFPCISTGIYGYPNEAAAHVATYTVRKFLEVNGDKIDRVVFCTFLDIDQLLYKQILQAYYPVKLID